MKAEPSERSEADLTLLVEFLSRGGGELSHTNFFKQFYSRGEEGKAELRRIAASCRLEQVRRDGKRVPALLFALACDPPIVRAGEQ